jgi:hypothetical protein
MTDKIYYLPEVEDLLVCLLAGVSSLQEQKVMQLITDSPTNLFKEILKHDPEFEVYADWMYMILDEIMEKPICHQDMETPVMEVSSS